MNLGTIWWEQLGCSLRLLNQLINHLQDCRSAVLQVSAGIPWRNAFLEELTLRRSAFSADRRLVQLEWDGESEPGECVLRNLCSQEVFIHYWPGATYAEYMASLEDIMLHDYYVWVSGIHREADIKKWADFVCAYAQGRQNAVRQAVFILEYDGPEVSLAGPEKISFHIESHNCRVFCLEAASALQNTSLMAYQAELALSIGGRDPEFCAALLEMGEALLLDPPGTTLNVIECDRSSTGTAFPAMTEVQIVSAVWKASLVLLFPILEQYRMEFIQKYRSSLEYHLPYRNTFGALIHSSNDLELADIWSIISNNKCHIPPEEYKTIQRFKKVRDTLAHIDTVPLVDVQAVLALK